MSDQAIGEVREGWRRVTKQELLDFLNAYPRSALHYDCCGISEPPLRSWNDFSEGKVWPESMVAKAHRYRTDMKGYRGAENDEDVYLIRTLEEAPK